MGWAQLLPFGPVVTQVEVASKQMNRKIGDNSMKGTLSSAQQRDALSLNFESSGLGVFTQRPSNHLLPLFKYCNNKADRNPKLHESNGFD